MRRINQGVEPAYVEVLDAIERGQTRPIPPRRVLREESMDDDVTFSEMNEEGQVTSSRTIKYANIAACPFTIMVSEHYREDGSCRCDDPDHTEMAEWGYRWNGYLWTAP